MPILRSELEPARRPGFFLLARGFVWQAAGWTGCVASVEEQSASGQTFVNPARADAGGALQYPPHRDRRG
jgi:hypothetical protein